jgi:hypothetical protein
MNMRLSMHILVGFLIGGLYFNIGNEASNVMDNFGLIFYSVVFLMFTSLLSMIVTCELYSFSLYAILVASNSHAPSDALFAIF